MQIWYRPKSPWKLREDAEVPLESSPALEIEILHDLLHGGIARDPTEVKKEMWQLLLRTTTTTTTSMAREFDLVVNGQRVGWWQLHNPELDPAPVKPSWVSFANKKWNWGFGWFPLDISIPSMYGVFTRIRFWPSSSSRCPVQLNHKAVNSNYLNEINEIVNLMKFNFMSKESWKGLKRGHHTGNGVVLATAISISFQLTIFNMFDDALMWARPDPTPVSPNFASGCYGLRPTLRIHQCYALTVFFFPGWNHYPPKKTRKKLSWKHDPELVTLALMYSSFTYSLMLRAQCHVTCSTFLVCFFFWGGVELVTYFWVGTMPWASTLSLSQYDVSEPTRCRLQI